MNAHGALSDNFLQDAALQGLGFGLEGADTSSELVAQCPAVAIRF